MINTYLPIGISLKNRSCLIVGGGNVALRKIETLLDYECKITVIAPAPVEKIEYFAKSGKLVLEKREYKSSEASSFGIAISASDKREVNKTVSDDCNKAQVPVNVVDDPQLCTFVFPAVIKRENLTIAVSTDGKSPFLAGHLRLILEEIFPDRWSKIAKHASDFRIKVRDRWPKDPKMQASCYWRFVNAEWKEILKKKTNEVEEELVGMLDGSEEEEEKK
ncbi:bifunctional precorrin-2 dehydrogenase/sirohydrochlorin ferrochelatase [Elusimicrobiota bacterium]